MFCTKCGSRLNEKGICPNCNSSNLSNSSVKKTSAGKVYLKIVGFSLVLFFFCTILKMIMRFSGVEISKTFNSILNYMQIAIPMFSIIFGIIPAVIIANKKNK